MNAHTSREETAYYLRLLPEHLDMGIDILADILTDPTMPPEEIERERGVIIQELVSRRTRLTILSSICLLTHPMAIIRLAALFWDRSTQRLFPGQWIHVASLWCRADACLASGAVDTG